MSQTPEPSQTRKPLKAQPKSSARRSKAEREALERAESSRKLAREAAAAQEAAAAEAARRAQYGLSSYDNARGGKFGDRGGRGGGGRGGRGGYMGKGPGGVYVRAPMMMGGSGGNAYAAGGWGGMGRGRGGGRTKSGVSGVKREPGVKTEPDGDIAMLGIKQELEDGGYISSDPDDRGNAQDIEYINIESDDDDEEGQKMRRRKIDPAMPVRVARMEHKQRQAGVNTDASSATAATLRKQAAEGAEAGKSFDAALADATVAMEKKAKARAKDVEVIGSTRKWKGVWQPEDDDDDVPVRIKEEPRDDENMLAVEPSADHATSGPSNTAGDDQEADVPDATASLLTDEPEGIDVKVKVERRKRDLQRGRPEAFQSQEEQREWEKQQEDFATMQEELGRVTVAEQPQQQEEPAQEEGDGERAEPKEPEQYDRKQDAVYLFQFPPVLPDLEAPSIKAEPISPELRAKDKKLQVGDTNDTAIKLEDTTEFGVDTSVDAHKARQSKLVAGKAGKLRIHKSGRATLSWGGTQMELHMGTSASFLQTAIMTQVVPKEEGGTAGGRAVSFGQIRGKLVVTPDWTQILGD